MTKNSPRIYTYKITFEEVPYYYYGVHKEKRFNDEYWGTPITHKWMWDFYISKKQILQVFDFTDEGWLKAQEVEKRLIKPVYNSDINCLNENCGGKTSLDICRENGKKIGKMRGQKNKEDGIGIFAMSQDELQKSRSGGGKKGGTKAKELGVGIHAQTKEERLENGKKGREKAKELGVGVYALTPEQRTYMGKKGGAKAKELGVGIHALTLEQRREIVKKINSRKWMCLETGFITNAGSLSGYQKARGIDISKRKRIE